MSNNKYKYTLNLNDYLTQPFEMVVLKHIKGSVPFKYSKNDNTISFTEETAEFIKDFRSANDGAIRECIWCEDNVNFYNKHQKMLVEAMEFEAEQIMERGQEDVLHFVKSFNDFQDDEDITFKEIAKCVYTNKRKDEPGDISWSIKNLITIWAVERVMWNLQNVLSEIEYENKK